MAADVRHAAAVSLPGPLVLAGAGRMGRAMLSAWLEAGVDPAGLHVIEPAPSAALSDLAAARGFDLMTADMWTGAPAGVLVLAVKPQMMDAALRSLGAVAGPHTLVISIAAGRTLASLAAALGPRRAIIRAMPNTPAAIGRGITVTCANPHVSPAQQTLCDALMGAVGEVHHVGDETLMDAVTAVSGSGPAYVFLLAETLADAGEAAGLPRDMAQALARATVHGAGELLRQSPDTAAKLREDVTSPGGTTKAALDVLMADEGMAALIQRAVEAAARRSRELSS
jgi:pyrroline-5-carboxylate reductase